MKSSKSGISTPKRTIERIQRRLTVAEQMHEKRSEKVLEDKMENITSRSGGNVFADLGLPDADDLIAKANLALHIRSTIKARKLTQAQAAEIRALDQPKISSIVNGRLDGFSSDRLMRFLNDLGCDVQISVSAPNPEARGRVVFA